MTTQAKLNLTTAQAETLTAAEATYRDLARSVYDYQHSDKCHEADRHKGSKLYAAMVQTLKAEGVTPPHSRTLNAICETLARSYHCRHSALDLGAISPLCWYLNEGLTMAKAVYVPYLHEWVPLAEPMDTGTMPKLIRAGSDWYLMAHAKPVAAKAPAAAVHATTQETTPAAIQPPAPVAAPAPALSEHAARLLEELRAVAASGTVPGLVRKFTAKAIADNADKLETLAGIVAQKGVIVPDWVRCRAADVSDRYPGTVVQLGNVLNSDGLWDYIGNGQHETAKRHQSYAQHQAKLEAEKEALRKRSFALLDYGKADPDRMASGWYISLYHAMLAVSKNEMDLDDLAALVSKIMNDLGLEYTEPEAVNA